MGWRNGKRLGLSDHVRQITPLAKQQQRGGRVLSPASERCSVAAGVCLQTTLRGPDSAVVWRGGHLSAAVNTSQTTSVWTAGACSHPHWPGGGYRWTEKLAVFGHSFLVISGTFFTENVITVTQRCNKNEGEILKGGNGNTHLKG